MASILCVTNGMPSVLYASVELARRLAAAGHHVVHAAPPETRELVEHQGLGFLPLEPSRYEAFLEADAAAGTLERILGLGSRRRQAREAVAADRFARAVSDVAPDLILIDGEMHEHILAATSTGVPVALLNFFVSIWRRPGLPPPHHLVRPGNGWRGSRIGTSLLWLELLARKRGRALSQRLYRIGCDRLSILRSIARDAGIDLHRETDDTQWLIPFTYRRLPVLSLHALEFEFPHRPPRRVRYVGPMVLESRIDRPLPAADRTRLDSIFARSRRGGGEQVLIYAGFGSAFSTDPALVRRLLGIVADRPDWELVISLSDRVEASGSVALPDRVHAFAWLPQLEMLRHADVAITHGGINTIDESIMSGVPMLIYCGHETDMAGNTSRVVHHGIGIAGDRQDTIPMIRERIERLLGEPHFRDNVQHLRARYTAYADERVAERAVEGLLEELVDEAVPDRESAPVGQGTRS